MKIVCLIKFVPNVEEMSCNLENNKLNRENVRTILNPDDASALALALRLKEQYDAYVEAVTMGPDSFKAKLRDLIRIGTDRAVIISDKAYAGSDTFATSYTIGRYLQGTDADIILTGTHTIDGDTAHVPAQIAELLDTAFLSGITKLEEVKDKERSLVCSVDAEDSIRLYSLKFPAVLGISRESKYKLPYVRYADLERYVDDKIECITNKELKLAAEETGLSGSKTQVKHTFARKMETRAHKVVTADEEGIEYVYQFLKEKGFINGKKSNDLPG